ncbi:MAG: hypothetical protein PHV06_00910 [bacterium]|nr:hypothetical protein [bacterium]
MKRLNKLLLLILGFLLRLTGTPQVYAAAVDENRIHELREEISEKREKIKDLDKEIKNLNKEIEKLSKEKADLKKAFNDNPTGINESKLNKVLSKLREQIEALNKIELDREIHLNNLKERDRELIKLLNQKTEILIKEVKEKEAENNLIEIDKRITEILLIQDEKNSLYKEIDQTYPEIPNIEIQILDSDSNEILNEKLKFVNDQLLLLDIKGRQLEENKERFLIEYKIIEILIDFYSDPSARKDEMFDQMQILAIQIQEMQKNLELNNEKINNYIKLKDEINKKIESGGSK